MSWLDQEAIDFFRDLEQNNNREWFEANKKRYEGSVKKPLEAFSTALIPMMQELDPEIDLEPKKALFRLHRDTRFSKDKTPYKTNAGLSISAKKNDFSRPGLYFHLDSNSIAVATGCYQLETAQLMAIRQHIASNLAEFRALQDDSDFVETFVEIRGDRNKKLAPEFAALVAAEPMIANKQFYVWAEHPPETAFRDDLPAFIMSHIRAAWPFNEFLMRGLS